MCAVCVNLQNVCVFVLRVSVLLAELLILGVLLIPQLWYNGNISITRSSVILIGSLVIH